MKGQRLVHGWTISEKFIFLSFLSSDAEQRRSKIEPFKKPSVEAFSRDDRARKVADHYFRSRRFIKVHDSRAGGRLRCTLVVGGTGKGEHLSHLAIPNSNDTACVGSDCHHRDVSRSSSTVRRWSAETLHIVQRSHGDKRSVSTGATRWAMKTLAAVVAFWLQRCLRSSRCRRGANGGHRGSVRNGAETSAATRSGPATSDAVVDVLNASSKLVARQLTVGGADRPCAVENIASCRTRLAACRRLHWRTHLNVWSILQSRMPVSRLRAQQGQKRERTSTRSLSTC